MSEKNEYTGRLDIAFPPSSEPPEKEYAVYTADGFMFVISNKLLAPYAGKQIKATLCHPPAPADWDSPEDGLILKIELVG